jgi:hypothetical protein
MGHTAAFERDGYAQFLMGLQLPRQHECGIAQLDSGQNVLTVDGHGEVVVYRALSRQGEAQGAARLPVGWASEFPCKPAIGFIPTVKGGTFPARILCERDAVGGRNEWVSNDMTPLNPFSDDRGFNGILELGSLGDFFIVINAQG